MSLRILIAGTTGESMPPPYAGIPKVSLLYSRLWKKMGHKVGVVFVYRPINADDLGANAEYFFEYNSKPNKLKKLLFLLKYFFANPLLYFKLVKSYLKIFPYFSMELILYSAYGVFIDKIFSFFKPDIVLSEAALIKTFMVAQVAQFRKVPVVFDVYGEIRDLSIGVNPFLDEERRTKYWKSFLGLAELVIGISNCADGALLYLPQNKVRVFYDTCDYNLYTTEILEGRQDLRRYFKLPENLFLVGSVGAFEFRKGHDHLIRAVAKLSQKGYNIGVAICGAGDPGKWKILAKEEGIEDKVYFFNDLSEINLVKFYKSLDLYLNLSNTPRSCGLDLALLEAMASGLPIIVYDNGALPEAIHNKENGFIIPTGDVEGVSQAILKIYQMNPQERIEMGKKSSLIAAKSDINKTAEIKFNWLKEVINNYNKNKKI